MTDLFVQPHRAMAEKQRSRLCKELEAAQTRAAQAQARVSSLRARIAAIDERHPHLAELVKQ